MHCLTTLLKAPGLGFGLQWKRFKHWETVKSKQHRADVNIGKAKWTADTHIRAPPCPLCTVDLNTSDLNPKQSLTVSSSGYRGRGTYCANLTTNNLRISLLPIYRCLPFQHAKMVLGKILRTYIKRERCLSPHWWVMACWGRLTHGPHLKHLPQTSCSYRESLTGHLWSQADKSPCIILYRCCMPLSWFSPKVVNTMHL